MWRIVLVVFLFSFPFHAYPATIEVPKDYAGIQDAIDAATHGDTIIVSSGTYVGNVIFKGKQIVVTSTDPDNPFIVESTIIDGNRFSHTVRFTSKEKALSILKGFTITNSSGKKGYAIYCNSSSPTITKNRITNHTAENGGGIYCYLSSPIITNNAIWDIKGTGIYTRNSSHIIKNNIICLCKTGISCSENAPVLITENDICFCGEGINCGGGASPEIVRNTICNNEPDGGVSGWYASPKIKYNIIKENRDSWAPGVDCVYCSDVEIIGNIILNNGDAYSPIGSYSGGIRIGDSSSSLIVNNIIAYNQGDHSGGGILISNSQCDIINNTIMYNYAGMYGAGIRFSGYSTGNITNNIIRENKTFMGSSQVTVETTCTVTVSYCNIQKGWAGVGNINLNPLFVDVSNDDFHLLYNSPCRDAGDNGAINLPDFDFEGAPRIAYGVADMGADEFYTQLYLTGNPKPGHPVTLKLTGIPHSSPVIMWVGSGVMDPPLHVKKYGDFYLKSPLLGEMILGDIPWPSGVLSLPLMIGNGFPIMDVPMQALVGDNLTNLLVIKVRQ